MRKLSRNRTVLAAILLLAGLLKAMPGLGAQEPDFHPFAMMLQGKQAVAAGNLEEAAGIFTRGIEDDRIPNDFRTAYHLERARVRVLQGRLGQALADADAAMAFVDESSPILPRASVYAFRGIIRVELGKNEGARADLEIAYRLLQDLDVEDADMPPYTNWRLEGRRHPTLIETVREHLEKLRNAEQ